MNAPLCTARDFCGLALVGGRSLGRSASSRREQRQRTQRSEVRSQRHFHHRDTKDTKLGGKMNRVADPQRFDGKIPARVWLFRFLLHAGRRTTLEVFKHAKPWKWLCRAERPVKRILHIRKPKFSCLFLASWPLCLCGDSPSALSHVTGSAFALACNTV